MSQALCAGLRTAGLRVRQVGAVPRTRSLSAERVEADLFTREGVSELRRLLAGEMVGAIVSLLGLEPGACRQGVFDPDAAGRLSQASFLLAKAFQEDLCRTAEEGAGRVFNVTALGGRFGLDEAPEFAIAASGSLGVWKTLRRECPRLEVKNIDISADLPPDILAARLLDEMAAGDDLLEVGHTPSGRWRLSLRPAPLESGEELEIDEESVLLVTGGADGITAAVAAELAKRKPRLILVGRTEPAPEPEETRGLDAVGLRRRFIERAKSQGAKKAPAEIERSVQRLLKIRRVRENLDRFRELGAEVEYHALDVRDSESFGQLIDDVYHRHGRLDGVIHGAGLLRDSLIRDKSPQAFAEVYSAKVAGAATLARKLRPEGLNFLVFFSSVVARFGNAGQADYAAANETLNKLACWLQSRWPARVVSINWGPWDAGMVSPELKRLYARRGVSLISPEDGVAAFLRELGCSDTNAPEVLISHSLDAIARGVGRRAGAAHRPSGK